MFITKWTFGNIDFDDARSLRELLADSQGIAHENEFDWFDTIAAHLMVLHEGTLASVARMYPDGDYTRIDKLFCRDEYKQYGYYELMLRLLLFKAQTLAGGYIVCTVPEGEQGLYQQFGFVASGEKIKRGNTEFIEYRVPKDGVRWFSMCKEEHK